MFKRKICILVMLVLSGVSAWGQTSEMKREYGFNLSEFFSGILSAEQKYSSSDKYKSSGYVINIDFYRNYEMYELGSALFFHTTRQIEIIKMKRFMNLVFMLTIIS